MYQARQCRFLLLRLNFISVTFFSYALIKDNVKKDLFIPDEYTMATDDMHLFFTNWFSVPTRFRLSWNYLQCKFYVIFRMLSQLQWVMLFNISFLVAFQKKKQWVMLLCTIRFWLFQVCLCLVWNQLMWNSAVTLLENTAGGKSTLSGFWDLICGIFQASATMFIIIKIMTENHVVLFFNFI